MYLHGLSSSYSKSVIALLLSQVDWLECKEYHTVLTYIHTPSAMGLHYVNRVAFSSHSGYFAAVRALVLFMLIRLNKLSILYSSMHSFGLFYWSVLLFDFRFAYFPWRFIKNQYNTIQYNTKQGNDKGKVFLYQLNHYPNVWINARNSQTDWPALRSSLCFNNGVWSLRMLLNEIVTIEALRLVCHGLLWYGIVWYGMVWYAKICFNNYRLFQHRYGCCCVSPVGIVWYVLLYFLIPVSSLNLHGIVWYGTV